MNIIVDIDGTLVDKHYNTTYDFLLDFIITKKPNLWRIRYYLLKFYVRYEWILFKLFGAQVVILFSQIIISIVLFMINYNELVQFAYEWIQHIKYDSLLVKILRHKSSVIVLSASIEPIVEVFAQMLNTKKYASSTFFKINNRIIFMNKRHLLNSKIEEIRRNKWFPYIYIVDNPEYEDIVSKNSKITIKHICCKTTSNYIKIKNIDYE